MVLVYFIGNGFDLSLGLNTGYQDFYKFYLQQSSHDNDIIALKNSIANQPYETWADLEMGLAEYTKNLNSPNIFLKCLEDIRSNLRDFIATQYQNKSYTLDYNKIYNDLSHPEYYLDPKILTQFQNAASKNLSSRAIIKIVTLNYTRVFEDFLQGINSSDISITHLHGTLDNSMVMGVSNPNQIVNTLFQDNEDIRELFVKPLFNDACLNENNETVNKTIDDADIIIIFGTSLGESDKNWWIRIGERMLQKDSKSTLIYYPFDKNKDVHAQPNHRLRWTKVFMSFLLDRLRIPAERREEVVERICIGINKPIFKVGQRRVNVNLTK